MSACPEALWHTLFDEPMPEGTTYWDFARKADLKANADEILYTTKAITEAKAKHLPPEYIDQQQALLSDLVDERLNIEIGERYGN